MDTIRDIKFANDAGSKSRAQALCDEIESIRHDAEQHKQDGCTPEAHQAAVELALLNSRLIGFAHSDIQDVKAALLAALKTLNSMHKSFLVKLPIIGNVPARYLTAVVLAAIVFGAIVMIEAIRYDRVEELMDVIKKSNVTVAEKPHTVVAKNDAKRKVMP